MIYQWKGVNAMANKPRRLLEQVESREKEEFEDKVREEKKIEKKSTVDQIISDDGSKNKQISAKVNGNIYEAFTMINRLQGLSNNSALNMLIAKYVRENKEILES